ncbi:ribosome small subunit-dependent GTPase A [Chloroflexota bacterium]
MNNPRQTRILETLGWNTFFLKNFQITKITDSVPARVISESKNSFQVHSQYGELIAKISGKLRHHANEGRLYPAVGDWVVIKPIVGEGKAVIHAVLPRRSEFSRKVVGERTEKQVVSANIDTVFIVCGLDGGRNLNLRRIERYLTLAWSSGASPVIILNKADLCPDVDTLVRSVGEVTQGVTVLAVSAKEQTGLDTLKKYLTKGQTVAFLGSSGVGKSSLINSLLGINKQPTKEVRPDDRMGRHTTTKRELILLPNGGIVIDTPGIRELQLWAGEDDLQETFRDIEVLAKQCRFKDCSHNAESGCAVRAAINRGEIDPARLDSFHKLQKELDYLVSREEQNTRLYEKVKWKNIAKWSKELKRQ